MTPTPNVPHCAWCGEDAVDDVVIEPARYSSRKATVTNKATGHSGTVAFKVITKQPITSPVCFTHLAMVRRNEAEAERVAAEKKAHTEWAKRSATMADENVPGQTSTA